MENTAGPSILKSTTANIEQSAQQISKNPKNWFKNNIVKIVIVVLVIGVLAEIVFGVHTLFSPSSGGGLNILPQSVNETTPAQISLVPDKAGYKVGDTVVVDVKLFTGSYSTFSSDLVLKYDPEFLQVEGEDFAEVGQIYSEYPAVQVDQQNGLIGISGITLPNEADFSGAGTFSKLSFKALKNGQTQITIDYQPQSTADSNVVMSGSTQDVLGIVVNADINISDAVSEETSSSAQACESFTQVCQDSTGTQGTQKCIGGAVVDGACGYDPKLTVSCEACKI